MTDTPTPCAAEPQAFTDDGSWRNPDVQRRLAALCARCPVLVRCREDVLANPDPVDGYVAGTTPALRKTIRARMRKAAA